jgi:hypothetical protein
MNNRNNQTAQDSLLSRTDGKPALISAKPTYHVPESFRTCTVEVQGGGDGAGSGSRLCLTESKGGQGRGKNLPGDEMPTSQVWN